LLDLRFSFFFVCSPLTVLCKQMADKKWTPVSLLATATHRFKGNAEKGELKFEKVCANRFVACCCASFQSVHEKGAELELFEERRGWYRGCVVGQEDERGLVPSNHIATRPKPKSEDVGAKQMSLADIEKMMEVMDDPDDRASTLQKNSAGRGKVCFWASGFESSV
jgi:hypothetical protein